jgi:Actin
MWWCVNVCVCVCLLLALVESVCFSLHRYSPPCSPSPSPFSHTRSPPSFCLFCFSTITLSTERFRCAEPLFTPPLLGREAGGVQDIVFGAVAQCDVDMRRDLLSNVVLSGGSTCFRGFPERLEKELRALTPGGVPVKVIAPSQRQHLVWMGASALASSPAFATVLLGVLCCVNVCLDVCVCVQCVSMVCETCMRVLDSSCISSSWRCGRWCIFSNGSPSNNSKKSGRPLLANSIAELVHGFFSELF